MTTRTSTTRSGRAQRDPATEAAATTLQDLSERLSRPRELDPDLDGDLARALVPGCVVRSVPACMQYVDASGRPTTAPIPPASRSLDAALRLGRLAAPDRLPQDLLHAAVEWMSAAGWPSGYDGALSRLTQAVCLELVESALQRRLDASANLT